MTVSSEERSRNGDSLPAAISTAIVRLLGEYTGRGPTKARTTIRDNVVVVMLEQTLTKGERSLAERGMGEKVIDIRHAFQESMRVESSDRIAELTGRRMTAMLSANHLDPDIAAEIYVLDAPPDRAAQSWQVAAEVKAELRK
jgi:uncharacterized protein YbcI